MLRIASRALDAQRYGLDVTGQNIANVNTAGLHTAVGGLRRGSTAGSVEPRRRRRRQALVAARAPLIEARLMFEQPARRAKARSPIISRILETNLGQPGASLDAALARFYNTYAKLAQSPISAHRSTAGDRRRAIAGANRSTTWRRVSTTPS